MKELRDTVYGAIMTPRAVIDTNVVFEGLTKQGGASRLVIEAWLSGFFQPCVSTALVYEYQSVLTRKLSSARVLHLEVVMSEMLDLAQHVETYFSWRPASPDPGDDFVIDCAMSAYAPVVTWNRKDFQPAGRELGLPIWSPIELLKHIDDTKNWRFS